MRNTLLLSLLFIISIQQSAKSEVQPGIYFSGVGYGHISRADFDGSNISSIKSGFADLPDLAIDKSTGWMYYTSNEHNVYDSHIYRIRNGVDGLSQESVFYTRVTNVHSIALDTGRGKMYWTEPDAGRILSANLDGSDVRDIVVSSGDQYFVPSSIAVDAAANKIYWTDNRGSTKHVYRSNADGSDIQTIAYFSSIIADLSGIALDTANGKMYWGNNTDDNIYYSNLDGGPASLFATSPFEVRDITFDSASNKLYWTGGGVIYRANMDGTGITTMNVTIPDSWAWGVDIVPVPEPASAILIGMGCLFLRLRQRKV